MAEEIQELTSRVSSLRPSRQSIIASRVQLILITSEKLRLTFHNFREKCNQGSVYTTLFRLDKVYNFSRLDLGIGMRPNFPDFIILFLWPILRAYQPEILLLQVAQKLHPALRVDVFLPQGITCGYAEYVNRQSYIFVAPWGSDLFLNSETQTDCSYQVRLVSEALP